jgi:hypothetical protein
MIKKLAAFLRKPFVRRHAIASFLALCFACEPINKFFFEKKEDLPTPPAVAVVKTPTDTPPTAPLPASDPATKSASTSASAPVMEVPLFTPKSNPELLKKLSSGDANIDELKTAPQVDPASISEEGLPEEIPSFAGVKESGYRVSYTKSKNPYFDSIRELMEQQKIFEAVVDSLNQTFTLPRVVDVQLTDCGAINAFYEPKTYRLIMCYEMIGSFIELFKPIAKSDEELFADVFGGTFFVFLHEAGHSLVHLLNLPITGREEDAVDQLATIFLLFGGDDGVNAALAAAQRFYISGENAISKDLPFWDEHSLGQQRFYNIACLIYGSNPEKYVGLVSDSLLPKERAIRCDAEFAQASNSWKTLLKPYIKSGAEKPSLAPTSITAPKLPEEVPTPPTNVPEVPSGDASACTKTSDHVVNLIMQAASKELATMTKEEATSARQEILDRVLTLSDELTETCTTTPWSADLQDCITKATVIDEAEKCLK